MKSVRAADGRRLAYAEYGDPSGRPVFFFQGTPSSRLWQHPDESIAANVGARIIRVDRPGFGRSDFQRGRSLLDWAADVARVADALDVDRFPVVGVSGGGPYVAACAHALPDRVTAGSMVGAAGPIDAPGATGRMTPLRKLGLLGARHAPPLLRAGMWLIGPSRDPERFFERFTAGFPHRDRELLARPEVRSNLIQSYGEAVRQGNHGFAHEVGLFAKPWGFALRDIRIPMFIWHGARDTSTPIEMARYMAKEIPSCTTHFLPDAGHFVVLDHYAEILHEVLAVPSSPIG